ncbi:Cell cycle control protein 50B [Sciurus carolinensis]|uniref:Cell cycle control protein n=1 Tax=Sciurus carolinensis TaxID=30640 RepID=A0AA41MGQ2_SCICA|nr:cell cycle control protein 50B [Sciurus carolinensis]MBZ3871672.1 Cell cycle control protein 50B [Sciurus carolinensis]
MTWSATARGAHQPDNTAFTQQRLPAWQPLLSASITLPLFFCAGLAFIGLGLGLYYSSNGIKELEYDYTGNPGTGNCSVCAAEGQGRAPPPNCSCAWYFSLPELFPGPVYLYYELTNFYQNNRRYGVSRDDAQLSGLPSALHNPVNECAPYQFSAAGLPIAPCGAIANSLFNDSFSLWHQRRPGGPYVEVPLDRAAIAWWTDYHVKFRNPPLVNGSLALAFRGTAPPPNWHRPVYELSTDPNNTGFINQDFVVWMRTAALPTFRKLYARIRQGNYTAGLPRGAYRVNITYNYPVRVFGGHKLIIFSNISWMGGKNPFLGIAYLVVGSLCILMGFVMLVVYIRYQDQNDEDDDDE